MLLNRAAWVLGCAELCHATPAKLWALSLEDGKDKILILTTFKGTHMPSSLCTCSSMCLEGHDYSEEGGQLLERAV